MNWRLALICMVGLTIIASSSIAQDGGQQPGGRRKPGPAGGGGNQIQQPGDPNGGPMAFDAAAFAAQMLQQFDHDGDAKLDQTELAECLAILSEQVRQRQQLTAAQMGGGQLGGRGGAGGAGGGGRGGAGGIGGGPGGRGGDGQGAFGGKGGAGGQGGLGGQGGGGGGGGGAGGNAAGKNTRGGGGR